jgi:hypothetical protein
LAYAFVTPRWNARGYPSYIGYGKNVEQAAIGLTLLGVTLFVTLVRRLTFSFASFAWLAIVFALIQVYYAGGMATISLLALVVASGVYFTWYDRLRDRADTVARSDMPRWHWWITSTLLALLLALMFLNSCVRPGRLDLHHNGEVISSALDLLDGGVPFRTHVWPHGIHDSGVVALLIRLTGNVGGALMLYWAIVLRVLGFTGLFLFALGLVREPLVAVLSAAIVSLLSGHAISLGALCLFPILSFHLLSVGTDRRTLFGAGALIGFGYLWRIDYGLYGLATLVVYLLIDRYYAQGYARDGRIWQHLLDWRAAVGLFADGSVLLLGVACSLILVRLTLGFPTAEWFRTTLVDMPSYHADSTGFPLPLAWKGAPLPFVWEGANFPTLIGKFVAYILLPGVLLVALGLYVFTLHKSVERRLSLDTAHARKFLFILIYSLFSLKSMMDRSWTAVIKQNSLLLLLLVGFDGLRALYEDLRRPRVVLAMLAACLATLMLVSARWPALVSPRLGLPSVGNLAALRSNLRPTATPGEIISPGSDPTAPEILEGLDQIRGHLDAHGVGEKQLLVYHSAAVLYPLLNRKLPTKYYCLGWAADPVMEQELIAGLERNRVRAFLRVNGVWNSMTAYDVPDAYRIPRVHRYIAEKEAAGQRFDTALGTLTILKDH